MMNTQVTDRILPEALGQRVTGVFALIEIAEREITKAKRKHPGRAKQIDDLFIRLAPTSELLRNSDLYRSHVGELIERAVEGRGRSRFELATSAEVLGILSELSLKAPLDIQHSALMDQLFRNVMGFAVADDEIPEPWPFSNRELLAKLSRTFRHPSRA